MTTKILITGSCGFIPSNFIRKCIHQKLDFNIVGLDKIAEPNNLRNMYINKANKTYFADILDDHILDLIFHVEKPDIVVHAAESHNIDDCINVNIKGTQNIVEKCIKYQVQKIIYLSTTEIYGHLKYDNESCDENSDCNIKNLFALTKLSGENLIRTLFNNECIIARSSTSFGPRQKSYEFIPTLINNILHNKEIILTDNGKRITDLTYVDDIIQSLLLLINSNCNGVYNISSNSEFIDLEAAHEIIKFFGKGYDLIKCINEPGIWKISPITEKIRSLGWEPEFKFKDVLPEVCEWYQNNQWFYK